MMRILTCALLAALVITTIGCNRPIVSEPAMQQQQQAAKPPIPDEELRAVSAIKPGTKIGVDAEAKPDPEADAIAETLQAFHRACQAKNADACLALFTDGTRQEVESWFETDEIFAVYTKSGQSLWCSDGDIVVKVEEVDGSRAVASPWHDMSGHTPDEIGRTQMFHQQVPLRKVDEQWLIDDPVIYLDQGWQQQVKKH